MQLTIMSNKMDRNANTLFAHSLKSLGSAHSVMIKVKLLYWNIDVKSRFGGATRQLVVIFIEIIQLIL